jgi:hypothetical protein
MREGYCASVSDRGEGSLSVVKLVQKNQCDKVLVQMTFQYKFQVSHKVSVVHIDYNVCLF